MTKYKRRFKKEEFQDELFTHFRDMPPQYLHQHDKLKEIAKWKSEHYESALKALDSAKARVMQMAGTHQDSQAGEEAKLAMAEIDAAIDAYGEASLSGNSAWSPYDAETR